MQKIKILVTGSNGQLGSEIKNLVTQFGAIDFIFSTTNNLDITQKERVSDYFKETNFDYCINCASYTAVDKAEEEKEKAYKVNVEGVKNLAISCFKYKVKLIHLSTDYVFDGNSQLPLTELDNTSAVNFYGKTKLGGEQHIQKILKNYFIIRTSWLYGSKGNNFVKTIINLSQSKKAISVVDDQKGSPTNAKDLALFILFLISTNNKKFGIINFSNHGGISWYDFAEKILKFSNKEVTLFKTTSEFYPTKAPRPKYSVLSLEKVTNEYNYRIRDWDIALKEFIDLNQ